MGHSSFPHTMGVWYPGFLWRGVRSSPLHVHLLKARLRAPMFAGLTLVIDSYKFYGNIIAFIHILVEASSSHLLLLPLVESGTT